MELVEYPSKLENISLKNCSDAIQQIIDLHISCPIDIYKLIAQFAVLKQCKVFKIVKSIPWWYQHEFHSVISDFIIPQINVLTNWNNYPIMKGDVIIILEKEKEVAIFDGKKLVNVHNIYGYNHPYLENFMVLLPKEFDMLDEFCPNYWNNIPFISMHLYINLNKYIEEIDRNSAMVINDTIYIGWSYFTRNGEITLIYTLYDGICEYQILADIIRSCPDNIYHMHSLPDISLFLENYTSICKEYHLYICNFGKLC